MKCSYSWIYAYIHCIMQKVNHDISIDNILGLEKKSYQSRMRVKCTWLCKTIEYRIVTISFRNGTASVSQLLRYIKINTARYMVNWLRALRSASLEAFMGWRTPPYIHALALSGLHNPTTLNHIQFVSPGE